MCQQQQGISSRSLQLLRQQWRQPLLQESLAQLQ
jgi:hypothetical protein